MYLGKDNGGKEVNILGVDKEKVCLTIRGMGEWQRTGGMKKETKRESM